MRTNESYRWKEWVETEYKPLPFKVIKKTSRLPLIPAAIVAVLPFTGILPTSVFLVLVVLSSYILHISKTVTL
jgi:hypothetical protein